MFTMPGYIIRDKIISEASGVIYRANREQDNAPALNNAVDEGMFTDDPYVRSRRPRSVLCVPLFRKSIRTGLLFLENRLTSGVFTPDRLETVQLLASQIASSIENAKLYEDLKQAGEKYRGIFENALEGIFQTTPDGLRVYHR